MELFYQEALGNEEKKKQRERKSVALPPIHTSTLLIVTAVAGFNVT